LNNLLSLSMICLEYWGMACKYWTCLCVAVTSVSQSSRMQGRKIPVDLSKIMYEEK
jgi:hypothetical protein